jgi:hypothetical protein
MLSFSSDHVQSPNLQCPTSCAPSMPTSTYTPRPSCLTLSCRPPNTIAMGSEESITFLRFRTLNRVSGR